MKKKGAMIYAIGLLLLMLIGSIATFVFAWKTGTDDCVKAIVGFLCGVVIAPIVHELGHVVLAKLNAMEIVFVKCFCLQWLRKNGKLRFSFASPFADDQTQVIPKKGGDIQKRFVFYSLGGLITEGVFFLAVTVVAVIFTCVWQTDFFFWGLVPYSAYLFLLNVLPLEYASGKTDALVYKNIRKKADVESAMLTAMEIQGRLYAGETFSQIDEKLYNAFPVLCEDEPTFALILDLKYRRALDEHNLEKAAEYINRLASIQEYLPTEKVQMVAGELVYLHSLNGNQENAQECSKYCEEYLKSEEVAAKRALAAYCQAFGKSEAVAPLLEQAKTLLGKERIRGLAKSEEKLLSRIMA